MKFHSSGKSLIFFFLCIALTMSVDASANSYTYGFYVPFTTAGTAANNTGPYYDGTGAELYLTFDNGQTTNTNQVYSWANLTKIDYADVGGSLTASFSQFTSYMWFDPGNSSSSVLSQVQILQTDQSGNGLFSFNIPAALNDQGLIANDLPPNNLKTGQFQTYNSLDFEVYAKAGLVIELQHMVGAFSDYVPGAVILRDAAGGGQDTYTFQAGYFASGAPAPVPLPPSVLLFGSAIACLFGFNRRKSIQQ